MKILRSDAGNVDFQAPIELTPEQRNKLISFMSNLFESVTILSVDEFRSERIGDKIFSREWDDPKELALLFKVDEINEDIVRKLGRSWMSVNMRRGFLIPQILSEASKKKVDLLKVDLEEFIRDYLKEHQEEIMKKREAKTSENIKLKKEKEEFNSLMKENFTTLRNMAKMFPDKFRIEDIEKREKRLEELKDKIREEK